MDKKEGSFIAPIPNVSNLKVQNKSKHKVYECYPFM